MREESKERLIKHIKFLEEEIKDYAPFRNLSWENYNMDRSKRRNVERWIENVVNSSIDISKLILNTEEIRLPETYREIVSFLALVEGFDKEQVEKISQWVNLRNIVAHEYLDIRWASIKRFVRETEPLYKKFLRKVKEYLKKRLSDNTTKENDK